MLWDVIEKTDGERHVVPRNDTFAHWTQEWCWCGPTDDRGVWVHHSFDRKRKINKAEHNKE